MLQSALDSLAASVIGIHFIIIHYVVFCWHLLSAGLGFQHIKCPGQVRRDCLPGGTSLVAQTQLLAE